jgi:hypothetical protein
MYYIIIKQEWSQRLRWTVRHKKSTEETDLKMAFRIQWDNADRKEVKECIFINYSSSKHSLRRNDAPPMSQPHFGISVRMKLTLPKVGSWSSPGLPKIQSSSSMVKTPRTKMFFISMERFWSVDAQNGLACAISTFAAQIMGKRRAWNQTSSLTPDH